MDWAKAKNILIFMFVLLNLFLSITIIVFFNSDNISGEVINDAYKILENRGVDMECEIPLYNKQVGTLISSNTILDETLIIKNFFGDVKHIEETYDDCLHAVCGNKRLIIEKANTFEYNNSEPDETIDLKDSKKVHSYLSSLFKTIKVPFEGFYVDKEETVDNGQLYIFRKKKDNYWLYSDYVEVIVSQKGVSHMKYSSRVTEEITAGEKIMPAYQVLIKNFTNDRGAKIKKIDLGFGEQFVAADTKVLDDIPVWRITITKAEKVEERYFKVYNGEEVKLNGE